MNFRAIFPVSILVMLSLASFSQNWSTFGGNSTRNGLSPVTGPQDIVMTHWSVTSAQMPRTLGNAVYTFGDRFVTPGWYFLHTTDWWNAGTCRTVLWNGIHHLSVPRPYCT